MSTLQGSRIKNFFSVLLVRDVNHLTTTPELFLFFYRGSVVLIMVDIFLYLLNIFCNNQLTPQSYLSHGLHVSQSNTWEQAKIDAFVSFDHKNFENFVFGINCRPQNFPEHVLRTSKFYIVGASQLVQGSSSVGYGL